LNPFIYKQPLVLFFGAGASVPLGKKTAVEFLEWLKSPQPGLNYALLSSICAQIEPTEELGNKHDVEVVLDHLEKFIAAGELLKKSEDASLTKVLEGLPLQPYGSVANLDENIRLRDQIKDLVVKHYFEINSEKAFGLYNPFFDLMVPWPIVETLPVFTTNYDLAIEKSSEHSRARFRILDGFSRETAIPEWRRYDYEAFRGMSLTGKIGGIVLFKLHGSVDWVRTPSGAIQRITSQERDPGQMQTILIYPSRLKREIHDEPFRTNYDYLLACLLNAELCVVIGFSFRDQEIVEELRQALGLNKKLKLVIIDPNAQAIKSRLVSKLGFEPRVEPIMEYLTEENAPFLVRDFILDRLAQRKFFFFTKIGKLLGVCVNRSRRT